MNFSKFIKYGFLIFTGLVLIGFLLKGKITHEKFDSEKWKNWEETEMELSLRWEMMNSLRNNYDLKSMSKQEITDMLGKPEVETNNEFYYYLGYAKHGIDTGGLTIKFNTLGKVTNFRVFRG